MNKFFFMTILILNFFCAGCSFLPLSKDVDWGEFLCQIDFNATRTMFLKNNNGNLKLTVFPLDSAPYMELFRPWRKQNFIGNQNRECLMPHAILPYFLSFLLLVSIFTLESHRFHAWEPPLKWYFHAWAPPLHVVVHDLVEHYVPPEGRTAARAASDGARKAAWTPVLPHWAALNAA